jgi:hypothetical protein
MEQAGLVTRRRLLIVSKFGYIQVRPEVPSPRVPF